VRLVTWNCHHGTIEERVEQLKPLAPDLVTVQECRKPLRESESVLWSGDLAHKGVAVVACDPTMRIEPVNAGLCATALPVIVHSPTPFILLALWTQRAPTYEACALKAIRGCRAVEPDLPMVVMGDLNITAKAKAVRIIGEEFGLVSAYHAHHQVEPGREDHPTHFWLRRENAPWHIDFCFIPERWVEKVGKVLVGGFGEWRDSDHRPVTVDVEL
jgi:exodeoxyribonuclease III